MIAAPRLATVGMKSFSIQSWSFDDLGGVLAGDLGVEDVGVLSRRVVAPDRHLLDVGDRGTRSWRRAGRSPGCGRAGSAPRTARPGCRGRWSSRSGRWCSRGCRSRRRVRRRQRPSFSALPCAVKMAPLASSRSLRSMPGPRGLAPTSRARLTPSKIFFGSAPISTPARVGNAQSSSSMTTPSSAFSAGSISSRRSSTGRSDSGAAGETEEQAVADLSGGSGHGHLEGSRGHDDS